MGERIGRMVIAMAAAWAVLGATGLGVAEACECARAANVDEATETIPVIFFGRVGSFEASEDDEDQWVATLGVQKVYKGDDLSEGGLVEVGTRAHRKQCGIDFRVGATYLVFADREGDRLVTSSCHFTERLKRAPMAPNVRSLAPVLPGKGGVKQRARRASKVFTARIEDATSGFAGSWHDVELKVRVTRAYKGTRRGRRLKVRVDERSCLGERAQAGGLLSDADLRGREAPFEEGGTYLFYTHGEAPAAVMTCHGNLTEAGAAAGQIAELEELCAGRACEALGASHARAAKLREELREQVEGRSRKAVEVCARQVKGMYGEGGAITELELSVQLRPDGTAQVTNVESRGTISDGSVYDRAVKCVAEQVPGWEISEFPGEPIEATASMKLEEARRPRFASVEVQMRF